MQRASYLPSYGHTPPRKSQNNHVVAAGVGREFARQHTPGFGSICEGQHFKIFVFVSEDMSHLALYPHYALKLSIGAALKAFPPQDATCDRDSALAGNNADNADKSPSLPSNAYTRLVAGISESRVALPTHQDDPSVRLLLGLNRQQIFFLRRKSMTHNYSIEKPPDEQLQRLLGIEW